MKTIVEKVMPYLSLGIALVFLITALIFISHLMIYGIIVGGILFLVAQLKNWFSPEVTIIRTKRNGRIIEHESN